MTSIISASSYDWKILSTDGIARGRVALAVPSMPCHEPLSMRIFKHGTPRGMWGAPRGALPANTKRFTIPIKHGEASTMSVSEENRRPIKARSAAWAQGIAQWLARNDISLNQISVARDRKSVV